MTALEPATLPVRFEHALPFGAATLGPDGTRFRLWAPDAAEVWVEIEGTGTSTAVPMQAEPDGWYTVIAPVDAGATTGHFTSASFARNSAFTFGGIIDTGGNAVGQQFNQEAFFTGRRVLQQFDQGLGLLLRQGQRRDTEGSALGNMLAVGFKHG